MIRLDDIVARLVSTARSRFILRATPQLCVVLLAEKSFEQAKDRASESSAMASDPQDEDFKLESDGEDKCDFDAFIEEDDEHEDENVQSEGKKRRKSCAGRKLMRWTRGYSSSDACQLLIPPQPKSTSSYCFAFTLSARSTKSRFHGNSSPRKSPRT